MKKRLFMLIPALTLLAGCSFSEVNTSVIRWTNINIIDKAFPDLKNPIHLEFDEGNDLNKAHKKGVLGNFSLIAPSNETIVSEQPTFTWSASENAVSYTLEVCSSTSFDGSSSSVVYAKETNISSTSFKLSSILKQKNIDYYWRVTAVNEYNSKTVGKSKVSEVRKFFYKIESAGEIPIPVGEAEDWSLHKVGSVADIAIDHNDFFGTGDPDSLKITFEKENTNQGPGHEKSDGWIVVQKAVEQDFYGTDSFYCYFYYMGHQSTILIRIIDQDGELWYKQVKFTQDARQLVLLKFDEFTLRTKDTIVQNEVFNYEHIQAIEVCFEKTFGDGCCVVSGMKAVNYKDYDDWFISKLDFNLIPLKDWTYESYNFEKSVTEDGSELKLSYTGSISSVGYGFAKLPLNRYFADGNGIKVKVKYTGYKAKNVIIRIYEPDKDRWSHSQPFSTLVEDEFKELTIPFMAFGQSSISEGKRQFYSIANIQFGLEGCNGAGTLTFKDFEVVTLPSVSENPKEVGNDGIIEDFDSYKIRLEAYERWETSFDNKDEGIFISSEDKIYNGTNVNCGQFTYKADMEMATYDIYTDVKVNGLNAIKFWIKDASVPSTEAPFSAYTGDDVSPLVLIQISLKDGRWYRYEIKKAPRVWTEYVIPFEEFTLYSGNSFETAPLESQNVVNFAFGMQYFYMYQGKGYPTYSQNNPVFMDNIMFASSSEVKTTALENALHENKEGITLVDNFDYESDAKLKEHWFGLNGLDFEKYELSDDVSSEGGTGSVKLDYKNSSSPSYATYPTISSDVKAKALLVDIKGDGIATIYINFYVRSGTNLLQYRHTITNPDNSWNTYTIGFGEVNFTKISSGGGLLNESSMQSLQRLSFGIVKNSDVDVVSSIYVDNIRFDSGSVSGVNYSTKTSSPIA